MEDRLLLQRFVKDNSQEAFAALTARYLNLVYAACRRELDDADAAEDVTQAVFLILARKAPSLGRNVVLSGWLFQTARFAAKNARLQATRRAAYEQKAAGAMMEQPQTQTEDEHWAEIEPLLNQSLAALKAGERDCVLLRFFQGASFGEIGKSLGLSEEAARKRVNRSLDKMRQFFTKNGIIVPAVALPVLLAAHAAKAVPLGLAPAVAQSTAGLVAGHAAVSLTGSHAYQLSEGVLKAMKIVQMKVAVGLTAGIIIGSGTYAVVHGMTLTPTKTPQAAIFMAALLPGHILKPAAGQATPTAQQVAERCRAAYTALTSYQGTTAVENHSLVAGVRHDSQTSASIQFARPGKIRTVATTEGGQIFAYVSDGIVTEESFPMVSGTSGNWKKEVSTEMAIGGATGVSQNAGTTIPALLLGTNWGAPLPLTAGATLDTEVREDAIDDQLCYVLTGHLKTPQMTQTTSLWVDKKTYLLRRSVSDINSAAQTIQVGGNSYSLPATKMHNDEHFTNERLNQPIPESTFTLPPVQ